MSDSDPLEPDLSGEWVDAWEEELESEAKPPWRRPLLVGVAAITLLSMALLPIYNVVSARRAAEAEPRVCGFDYCVVQEAMRADGLDLEMSRLANTFLDEEAARSLADRLTDHLGVRDVGLQVVSDLPGSLGGTYDREAHSIRIERPARSWIVIHEVAHIVESGHGEAFQSVVADLVRFLGQSG